MSLVLVVQKEWQGKLVFKVTKATVEPQDLPEDLEDLEHQVKEEEEDLMAILEEEVLRDLWVIGGCMA